MNRGARRTGRKAGRRAARVADLGGDAPIDAPGADVAVAGATEDAVLAPAMGVSETAAVPKQSEAPAADRRDQTPPRPRSLLAYIDKGDKDRIAGWVYDPQQPHEVIALELLDGNTRLASVLANRYRSDLRWLGFGDGRHGFNISLAEVLPPGGRHVLHLRCADTGKEIPGSPITIERSVPAAGQALDEPAMPDQTTSATDKSFADRVEEAGGADPAADTSSVDRLAKADGTEPEMHRPVDQSLQRAEWRQHVAERYQRRRLDRC